MHSMNLLQVKCYAERALYVENVVTGLQCLFLYLICLCFLLKRLLGSKRRFTVNNNLNISLFFTQSYSIKWLLCDHQVILCCLIVIFWARHPLVTTHFDCKEKSSVSILYNCLYVQWWGKKTKVIQQHQGE